MSLWVETSRQALPGDWAARPTFRVQLLDGRSAILVETTPDGDPATPQGHKIADFVTVGNFLRDHGFHAPEIYAADPERGMLLSEDLGQHSWARSLITRAFYEQAVDTLIRMRDLPRTINLPEFSNSYIYGRTVWFMDEYRSNTDRDKRMRFIQAWDDLLHTLRREKTVFLHGDFHPGNLMKCTDGSLGLLDFGAAMWGYGEYDLVNLLEDIRRDVPDDIKTAMKTRYGANEDIYAIMHAQFYCRLLGQMTKRGMAVPNKLMTALSGLIHRHSVLAPLKTLVLD